jgi:2-dehydro-3-deoxyphosphogluconate aldolase/(4S)-4-hydroxy-2-oxoglutarate aldolase
VTFPTDAIAQTHRRVLEDGVILCVRFPTEDPVRSACRAAIRGGLRVLEITLTTPGAMGLIREFSADPDLVVGAGTVLTADEVSAVAEAGGRFTMSPVFDSDVVDRARDLGLLAIPGASTPTEIVAAHRHGAAAVKVFPSGALGGPAYLHAIRGPLGGIPLIPTSGPTTVTMSEYVAAGAVAVGVGGEVFGDPSEDAIETAARRVRSAMDEARGQNSGSESVD